MITVSLFKKITLPYTGKWIEEVIILAAKKEKRIKGEVEVIIVGDNEIKKLNHKYRGKNKITDVISFAWQEDKMVETEMLGQIYICYPQIKRQAKDWGVTAKEEFARMLIHGLLHLSGYDHQSDTDATKMFSLQEKIINEIFKR